MSDPLHVLVVLGTDHHPFDRLVQWIDEFAATQEPDYRCLVQHGYTTAPARARDGRSSRTGSCRP
jgi:UDP-N-acetylglucosamine transferase subunit ALG13